MPIAIVGLSCRLPGGISDPKALWHLCAEQRDAWQPLPNERMNNASFYHPDPARNGTVRERSSRTKHFALVDNFKQSNVRGGYFLTENPGFFNAKFFNLTEMEAKVR